MPDTKEGFFDVDSCSLLDTRRGDNTIDGLEVITSGEVYDEEKKAWERIGLLEVKPRECTFDLDVTRARLHGLPLGSSNAKGKVTIEDVAAPKD